MLNRMSWFLVGLVVVGRSGGGDVRGASGARTRSGGGAGFVRARARPGEIPGTLIDSGVGDPKRSFLPIFPVSFSTTTATPRTPPTTNNHRDYPACPPAPSPSC